MGSNSHETTKYNAIKRPMTGRIGRNKNKASARVKSSMITESIDEVTG